MGKPFAAFDIDGTILRTSLFFTFVETAVDIGVFDNRVFSETAEHRKKWAHRAHQEAFNEYEKVMLPAYWDQLKGLSVTDMKKVVDQFIKDKHRETYVFTRDLIKELKKTHFLIAISGSAVEWVEPFAKLYGFDEWYATISESKDGIYTGVELQVGSHDKDNALKDIISNNSLSKSGSVAVGDTVSDIPMINLAERKIAFNPESQLFDHAKNNNWEIVVERKNVIYKLKENDGRYILA